MIIAKLSDGLGNQMFQYALGKHLACRHDTELRLDLSWFENRTAHGGTDRTITIDGFDIDFTRATEHDIQGIVGGKTAANLLRRYGHHLKYAPRLGWRYFNYVREIQDGPDEYPLSWAYRRRFYPGVFDIGPDAYLDGYWQAPEYFEESAEIIRDDFSVTEPPEGQNADTMDAIESNVAVSIHVRRGDQVEQGPDWSDYGNALPETYYEQAVKHITERISDPHLFVFSDDPEWARTSLEFEYPTTFVTHNDGSTDYEDIRLMRHCDHHVIANSTFSWWGAWLNSDPEKRVVAPSPWKQFGYPDGIVQEWDLIPDDWTVLQY